MLNANWISINYVNEFKKQIIENKSRIAADFREFEKYVCT
ncbi:hypothetical protein MC28_F141 (plasmid) [Bacillus thuringiensis MC28]|nr:hypothetical protein MC28_F141 [Bacillus thuringiensis MC28]EEM55656.1 hypothetical protein bthur0007_65330 [Bacillus thuringiensis serovar monterrey BGSC 4AJ1]